MPFWANSTLASPIVGTMHLGPHLRKTPPHHWRLHHFFLPYIFEQKNWLNKIIVLHWRCSWKSGRLMAPGGMIPRHKLYQHWARAQSHRVAIPKARHKRVFTGGQAVKKLQSFEGLLTEKSILRETTHHQQHQRCVCRTYLAYWFGHVHDKFASNLTNHSVENSKWSSTKNSKSLNLSTSKVMIYMVFFRTPEVFSWQNHPWFKGFQSS